MTLTHGELFAGISGFGKGFAQAGIETLWHVEIDEKCQVVLERHYPHALILSDVRDCGVHNLPPVDIISFGSPCQDLSVAGKRKGLIDGEKSCLFFEAIRIVDELKPTFAVWENVPGAFSANSGRDFATVLASFRDIGACDIAWTVLDAQYFALAQRRRRVFLIADFRGERAAKVLFESSRSAWDSPPSREAGTKVADPVTRSPYGDNEAQHRKLICGTLNANYSKQDGSLYEMENGLVNALTANGVGTCGADDNQAQAGHLIAFDRTRATTSGDIAGTLRACGAATPRVNDGKPDAQCVAYGVSENQRAEVRLTEYSRQLTSGGGKPGQGYPAALTQYGVRRLTPTEACRLQGFSDDWNDGQSDSARYRQLGNAVAVPCAHWLGRRILEAL